MRVKVITTITSEVNLDSFETEHSVQIDDVDGISSISSDILYGLILGGLNSTRGAILSEQPHLRGRQAAQIDPSNN